MTTIGDRAVGLRRALHVFGPAAAVLLVQQVLYPAPIGILARGVIVGGLTALTALGMALVYRASRIVNFAQADLGGAAATFTVLLIGQVGLGYLLSAFVGLIAALATGAIVELVVIRRFRHAPRLIVTVATIGLAQVLTAAAVLLPRLWHIRLIAPRIDPPFKLSLSIDPIVLSANDLIAAVVAPVVMVAIGLFLGHTRTGVAIRASADRSERALTLGIRVQRLQTIVWSLAAGLAFVATFLRAGILGLPVGSALGLGILLRALAALMLGRLTDLTTIATSAVALGVLELGVGWNVSSTLLLDPVLAVVVVVALVLRRPASGRAERLEASSWRAADDVRPIPRELRSLREVRLTRGALVVAGAAVMLVLPHILAVDLSLRASAVLVYATFGLSLVVLTGWSGQVSLGQVAFFAIGAAVAGKATSQWHLDLTLAVLLATVVGALVAAIVGLPAVRLRGLHLAVVTFAFALSTTSYLLNDRFFDWIPVDRIPRPALFGRVDISSATSFYYVCLGGLVLAVIAVVGLRASPTGRALIAVRENEQAGQAYGIGAARAKLVAFAVSGALAAFAGAIFVHHQQAFGVGPYDPGQNLVIFTMVVVGGVASPSGALIGAFVLRGLQWFLPGDWQFLATGLGTVVVLWMLPSGLGGLLFRLRDDWLRWVARRHDIRVPSLVADTLVTAPPPAPPPRRPALATGPSP